MRRALLTRIHNYLICAVCEKQNIRELGSGYKLNSSFRSYVCGKCVESKKREIEAHAFSCPERFKSMRKVILKFESKRDGIISHFVGRLSLTSDNEVNAFYVMEEAK